MNIELRIDYSQHSSSFNHNREYYSNLDLEIVTPADIDDNGTTTKTITFTDEEGNSSQSTIRFTNVFNGAPVSQYQPTAEAIYALDTARSLGLLIHGGFPEFPDINDFLDNNYTSTEKLNNDIRTYEEEIDRWYEQIDQVSVSSAEHRDANGVISTITLTEAQTASTVRTDVTSFFNLNTELIGSDGDDQLTGYDGDDLLMGGRGNDTLVGGNGSDTFHGIGVGSSNIESGVNTIDGTDLFDLNTTDTVLYAHSKASYDLTRPLLNTGGMGFGYLVRSNENEDQIINFDRIEFQGGASPIIITQETIAGAGFGAWVLWSLQQAFETVRPWLNTVEEALPDNKYSHIIRWYKLAETATAAAASAAGSGSWQDQATITTTILIREGVINTITSEAEDRITEFVNNLPLPQEYKDRLLQEIQNGKNDLDASLSVVIERVISQALQTATDPNDINWSEVWNNLMNGIQEDASRLYQERPGFDNWETEFDNPNLDPDFQSPPDLMEPEQSEPTQEGDDLPNLILGGIEDNTIYAKGGNDIVIGGAGNDRVIAANGAGDDNYYGGEGYDTIVFSSASLGISVDTANGLASGSEIGIDSVFEFEEFILGSGNDVFLGSAVNETIIGGGGFDQIDGAGGLDTVKFDGNRSDYDIQTSNNTTSISLTANGSSLASLQNVEQIEFNDETVQISTPNDTQVIIYRFFNTYNSSHFYTASASERDNIIQNLPQYQFEGNGFGSNATEENGGTAVFRFYNTLTGTHFFTASADERQNIASTLPQFIDEGVAYYAYTESNNSNIELYRFYNTSNGTHFYTTSGEERDNIIQTIGHYIFEGTAYYVDTV